MVTAGQDTSRGISQAGAERPESLKIVVTDPIISRFEEALKADGGAHRWDMAAAWTPERKLDALAGADVVVCSSLGPAEAAAAARARLIHVTGAGYDKISFPHLVPSAIVANTFHHARPIAEHVLMVTLMLARNVAASDKAVRAGQWRTIATADDVPFHPVLADLTLGLVGLGSIGAEVARVATALGMKVRAVRRNAAAPLPDGVSLDWVGGHDGLNTLLAVSDVVVVTVPLDSATEGMIGHAEFAAMKPSAFLINVARGPVVDQAALFAALTERRIAGAGHRRLVGITCGRCGAAGGTAVRLPAEHRADPASLRPRPRDIRAPGGRHRREHRPAGPRRGAQERGGTARCADGCRTGCQSRYVAPRTSWAISRTLPNADAPRAMVFRRAALRKRFTYRDAT